VLCCVVFACMCVCRSCVRGGKRADYMVCGAAYLIGGMNRGW
jgi:hypothetical protein